MKPVDCRLHFYFALGNQYCFAFVAVGAVTAAVDVGVAGAIAAAVAAAVDSRTCF